MEPLRRQSGAPVAGILGDNFMQSFCVTLDYRGKYLRLDAKSREPKDGFTIQAPKHTPFNPIAVPIEVMGKPLEAIIDTGAYDIGMPSAFLAKLGLANGETLESRGAMSGGLIGGDGKSTLARVSEIKVGKQTLAK
jgi:hypothetical protein